MLFTIDELAAYLPESTGDPGRAALLIDLTRGVVYQEVPPEYADVSVVAKSIGLEVAARAYRNVEGFVMESVDDYTYRRDTKTRSPGVYLTEEERIQLRRLNPVSPSRARSVKLRSMWSA